MKHTQLLYGSLYSISRVIALPSVKYSGRVETNVFESRLRITMVYISLLCDLSFIANIILFTLHPLLILTLGSVSRVIVLPSVKYGSQVETDVSDSRLGRGETSCEPAFHENNN